MAIELPDRISEPGTIAGIGGDGEVNTVRFSTSDPDSGLPGPGLGKAEWENGDGQPESISASNAD